MQLESVVFGLLFVILFGSIPLAYALAACFMYPRGQVDANGLTVRAAAFLGFPFRIL